MTGQTSNRAHWALPDATRPDWSLSAPRALPPSTMALRVSTTSFIDAACAFNCSAAAALCSAFAALLWVTCSICVIARLIWSMPLDRSEQA